MKILVVQTNLISHFPPTRNLINVLLKCGHKVTVITHEDADYSFEEQKNLRYIILPRNNKKNIVLRVFLYPFGVHNFRHLVRKEMEDNDILWTTTDSTVKLLGKEVLRHKHVMQLMELIEDIPLIDGLNFPKLNIKKYARKAYKVVVPEYNRAHIQKTWWGLEKLPSILPNKPFDENFSAMEVPPEVQETLREIDGEQKKIVLYQGVFYDDRDLSKFAEAIEGMPDYRFYIMGRSTSYREELCQKYPSIKYIPFIAPPFHLLVTPKAHIGVLPYKAGVLDHYSLLNGLFCAPNKIFEYAKFGVPMLGTDVPGLRTPFEIYDMGYICAKQTSEEIREMIRKIEARYDEMCENCHEFYNSVNLKEIVSSIIGEDE